PVALEGAGIEPGADMVRPAVLHGIQGAAETVLINGLTPLQDEEQTAHSSLRGRRLRWWPSKGAVRTGQCVDQESAEVLSHRVLLDERSVVICIHGRPPHVRAIARRMSAYCEHIHLGVPPRLTIAAPCAELACRAPTARLQAD